MPLLSILTAAVAERAGLIAEVGDSLATQQLPDGWALEWIVQEDGPDPGLAEVIGRFSFARYAAHGEWLGIAVTRNIGLTRVSGELVQSVDSDDLILPGGLATAVEAFAAFPGIHWVSGQADDLLPDGTRVVFEPYLAPGLVEPGVVGAFIEERDMVPIACPGLMMRTTTVRAMGGWAANPRWEDTALFVALAELTPGYVTPEVTWLYRQHDGQTSRQSTWPTLQAELWVMVRQRISALRELALPVSW
jgi:glycosyltransferase involved in cell wall biosynthesis